MCPEQEWYNDCCQYRSKDRVDQIWFNLESRSEVIDCLWEQYISQIRLDSHISNAMTTKSMAANNTHGITIIPGYLDQKKPTSTLDSMRQVMNRHMGNTFNHEGGAMMLGNLT